MTSLHRLLFCFTIFIATNSLFAVDDSAPQFRAGAATSNITPPLGELIVGGWIPQPATHIHDELHARSLVLDDGETKLAIVICDNVGIPREVFDRAKSFIEEETQIPASHVLTAATHTHSATTARGENKMAEVAQLTEYQQFLARRIADSVRIALNRLQPAEIGFGSVDEPSEVFNRRWFVTDPKLRANPFGGTDEVRMNPPRANSALIRPAGPIDPEIAFLSLRSIEGEPIALLANYSLHYVGGVPRGHVSADYFAIVCNELSHQLESSNPDQPFVGIMTNGTSGDINNINFQARSPRLQPYEKMTQVGQLVAQRILETLPKVKYQSQVKLAAAQTELELQVRKPTPEMLDYFAKIDAAPEDEKSYHSRERIYSRRVKHLAASPDTVSVPLQAFRIGEIGIAAIPFEVFVEIGLELKDKSPIPHTFTIELANGSYGYLPTPKHRELGGYETWMGTNNVEKEASDKIKTTLLDLFTSLRQ